MALVNQDEEHLRLLAIFHYVLGGITMFFACFPLLHIGFGIFILASPSTFAGPHGHGDEPPQFVGWLFVIMGSILFVLGQSLAVCTILAGNCIRRRKSYMFIFVIACLECLMVPLGTILGVFTIITLSRDPVKAIFDGRGSAPPPIPAG